MSEKRPIERPAYSEEQRKIVRRYVAWYAGQDWSAAKASRRIGCSASVLSQIINEKYPGDAPRYIAAMAAVLARAEGEEQALRPPPFALTTIAEEVNGLLEECLNSRQMGFICGTSGVGKSMAAETFAEAHAADVVMITCSKGNRDSDVLRRVAMELELPWAGTTTEMLDRLVAALVTMGHPLLVVDECDFLGHCLHVVRQLRDRVDCGLVLIGTPAFLAQLRRHRTGTEGQALGRISHFLDLTKIVETDAEMILAPFGLPSDALRLAWHKSLGNARRLVNGVLVALRLAAGERVGAGHIAAAFERLLPVEL